MFSYKYYVIVVACSLSSYKRTCFEQIMSSFKVTYIIVSRTYLHHNCIEVLLQQHIRPLVFFLYVFTTFI